VAEKARGRFGYNSDWWNTVVLFALAVAALAALATAFATYAVITTQKLSMPVKIRSYLPMCRLTADPRDGVPDCPGSP
jgi:hypothetical protein